MVGPYDNNVFVLRCKQTGDAVLLDAANEHELLLELCQTSACARCSRPTATGTTSRRCPQVRNAGIDVGIAAGDHVLIKETYDFVIDDGDVIRGRQAQAAHHRHPGPHARVDVLPARRLAGAVQRRHPLSRRARATRSSEYANFDTIIHSIEDRLFRPLDRGTLVLPGHGIGHHDRHGASPPRRVGLPGVGDRHPP